MQNPSPTQFVCAGAVLSRKGWEEAAGLHLQVPSSPRVQTAFFSFYFKNNQFPPTPLQPVKSPLITILFSAAQLPPAAITQNLLLY